MGLFGRKAPEGADLIAAVTARARESFAQHGVETTVEATDDPSNPALRGADGYSYFVHNLVVVCRAHPQRQWGALIDKHVRAMVATRLEREPEDLDPDTLRAQIRTRLLPDDFDDRDSDFSYARPFAPGLMLALCIDYPHTVTTLFASKVEKLAVPENELFLIGQANTNREPIDEHTEIAEGVWLIGGGSLFVASKAADLAALIANTVGDAPLGLVFSLPHRGIILYTVPKDVASLVAINKLLTATDLIASDSDNLPGGLLSADLYFWADGLVEKIGGRHPETGNPFIETTGRFEDVILAISAD